MSFSWSSFSLDLALYSINDHVETCDFHRRLFLCLVSFLKDPRSKLTIRSHLRTLFLDARGRKAIKSGDILFKLPPKVLVTLSPLRTTSAAFQTDRPCFFSPWLHSCLAPFFTFLVPKIWS